VKAALQNLWKENTMDGSNQNQEATSQSNNFKNGWTDDEKKALASVTFPLIEMQKAYGRQLNAKLIMQGWEIKFAGKYSIEQLLYALDKYTDKHDDFPSPANLIDILSPQEPKVTESQFIAAQKWQERNNDWSQYTEAYETISAYKRQNEEKREEFKITCEKVKQLAASSVKRINQIVKD
jgi:hypothetical protein